MTTRKFRYPGTPFDAIQYLGTDESAAEVDEFLLQRHSAYRAPGGDLTDIVIVESSPTADSKVLALVKPRSFVTLNCGRIEVMSEDKMGQYEEVEG